MNSTQDTKVTAFPGARTLNAVRATLCWPRDTILPLEVIRPIDEEEIGSSRKVA